MPLQITDIPLAALTPYDRNARTHPKEQIKAIERSLARFGWCTPIAIADGVLIYGHARLIAARNLLKAGIAIPNSTADGSAPVVDLSHLSDDERRAYVIADNQLAATAGWDEELLSAEISALQAGDFDVSLLGFTGAEIDEILIDASAGADANKGELLERMDITIGDPSHKVERGDHWTLAKRHHLLCVSVIEDWPIWGPLLKRGCVFVPYPGPFVPFATKAEASTLVMVQPDEYAAGHLIDRFAEAHGEAAVAREEADGRHLGQG